MMTIDMLCRVVDNYGDIGVVYRLARALSELDEAPRLRLVVDDLSAFSLLEPGIDPGRAVQSVRGWTVLSWALTGPESAAARNAAYEDDPALVVLECFACGRPDWLEAMLFDPSDAVARTIVNLEYLTAEPYADEFHRMPSLTRSRKVRKYMFLPGFTAATGGLILDGAFMRSLDRFSRAESAGADRRELLARAVHASCRKLADAAAVDAAAADPASLPATEDRIWALVFGYERDYGRMVDDLAMFAQDRPVLALVAGGKSQPCFMAAWERAGRPFPALALPFLDQETWDAILAASDFLVVRGEDSMSRAALAGKPFLWQAYPQDGAHQLVKVKALLDRMKPHFTAEAFRPVEAAFLAVNDRLRDSPLTCGSERVLPLLEAAAASGRAAAGRTAARGTARGTAEGFASFAKSLSGNGNLALNLMTYLREIV